MQHALTRTVAAVLVAAALAPTAALAASGLEVSGWVPYWRAREGSLDASKLVKSRQLDSVHLFAFGVAADGSLVDEGDFSAPSWKKLLRAAKSKRAPVIPTVTWTDGAAIHAVLSSAKARQSHVDEIAAAVRAGKYDGIDIDYEGKLVETKPFFSAFLAELREALDGKTLSCTIEARTPPASLYRVAPSRVEYANDYPGIAAACDRVNIMAYDQGRVDILLNEAKAGEPYNPVADVDWVRKVAELALESIPAEKLYLGVATYGREYELTVAPNWFKSYRRIASFNPGYADGLARDLKIEPARSRAGEAALSYFSTSTPAVVPKTVKAPAGTPAGLAAAARALAYANQTGQTVTVNYLTWSDADAVAQKVALAEELGLAGVAVFKIDGSEDRGIWRALRR